MRSSALPAWGVSRSPTSPRRRSSSRAAGTPRMRRTVGLTELERASAVKAPFVRRWRDVAKRFALTLYLGAIAGLVAAMATGLAFHAARAGAENATVAIVIVLALLASSQLAVAVVNWLV